jgi:hypothetical protein
MASPVVVSRIQNRRGTQDQFDSLYPGAYTSAVGASSSGSVVTVTSTAGVYENGLVSVISGTGQFAPGTTVTSIDSATQFTVNVAPTIALSGATVSIPAYSGTGGLNLVDYPSVLFPGEIALCTDSRNIYIGNINGEYILFGAGGGGADLSALLPLVLTLPPAVTYTVIPELTFQATPFFNLLYDITDSSSPDWNDVNGTSFARNGQFKITAVQDFTPVPNSPYPDITSASLVDDSVEVKNPADYTLEDISFIAQTNGTDIEISYKHDFPVSLTFSSTTIRWQPF